MLMATSCMLIWATHIFWHVPSFFPQKIEVPNSLGVSKRGKIAHHRHQQSSIERLSPSHLEVGLFLVFATNLLDCVLPSECKVSWWGLLCLWANENCIGGTLIARPSFCSCQRATNHVFAHLLPLYYHHNQVELFLCSRRFGRWSREPKSREQRAVETKGGTQ